MVAAALGCIALGRSGKMHRAQIFVGAVAALLTVLACSDPPAFWPLAIFTATVPWLPIAGRAEWSPALLLPVALLGTTVVTHAIFFGEDRYHVVVTPALCILAAAALRRPMNKPTTSVRS